MDQPSPRAEQSHRLSWVIALLVAAVWPLAVGVVRPGVTGYGPAMLPDMIHGRAYQPFVKRQLVPLVVRAGLAITPRAVDDRLREVFARSALVRRLHWPAQDAPEFVLTLLVMYLSLLGFFVVLRSLLRTILVISPGEAFAVTLMLAMVLPITYAGKLYIYDYTQLLLFTAGLLCMIRRQWGCYYPLFVLACINKETSILLAAVFAVWQGRQILTRANLGHFIAQFCLGLAVCGWIAWIYQANPGTAAEWHLHRNLAPPVTHLAQIRLAFLGAGVLLAVWSIRQAPPAIGRGFLVTLVPLVIATLFFGFIDELRDYYEALPLGLCLVLLTIGRRWGVRPRTAA